MDIRELKEIAKNRQIKNAENIVKTVHIEIEKAAHRGETSIFLDLSYSEKHERRLVIKQLKKDGFRVKNHLLSSYLVEL
ncbi:hypothetical protein MOC17_20685 [Bacillus haynesii]|uniref:hypothetical protein n=1 Tax=Bacillus haynesii TaxID=1925021 RepID=UPI00227E3995|nr:hypothetical protein [Bacillus haynesii]MCY8048473.1 hypothetical protein [Bacillus haynesii]MCY9324050.1 hypothetical protein [Bacillus haynesii]